MAQRKHLDDFLRGRIIGRLECGRTHLEVSEELGIAQSIISRFWQRFQDDDNVSRCYSTDRPRVKTPNEDRYLAVTAKRNRRSTASDLSRQLSSATGTTVSRQTVYRRLGHIGLYARKPVRCVPLTATHCRLRLAWSREHALWTPQQWSCVMFSDESRFSLQSNSRRTFIWRAPGTRYHQENTIERHRYGGAGWLVWGGIILGSRTDLHVQSVTMTGHIYRDVILEQHVVPSSERIPRTPLSSPHSSWLPLPGTSVNPLPSPKSSSTGSRPVDFFQILLSKVLSRCRDFVSRKNFPSEHDAEIFAEDNASRRNDDHPLI
ncbi:hypothetical protein AVEN_66248-1 [Araneus ventricosus]|uniref:Transposase Tc1-like domain-containing protein n=1 Tax=Araneus ventricosus TaxID=182803 RepID=A0A4Y2IYJ1_ARAVE|nr:hypothetical protein AVEN_66248-1 [Araneus ventricosus]